jgi:hypothetical protein
MWSKRSREQIEEEASSTLDIAIRYPLLSFDFSEAFRAKFIPPSSFTTAFEKAKIILRSDLFRTAFLNEVQDADIRRFDDFLNQKFEVCTLRTKATITAFAAVYRESNPTTVFFNPWMLLNISDKERMYLSMILFALS